VRARMSEVSKVPCPPTPTREMLMVSMKSIIHGMRENGKRAARLRIMDFGLI